jgi:type IV pilus assembly protein PilB
MGQVPKQRLQLEDLLLRHGAVSQEQLAAAHEDQRQFGGDVGRILVDRGVISEILLLRVLSHQLGIPMVDPEALELRPELLQAVPVQICERYGVIPVDGDPAQRTLRMATPDPANRAHSQEVETALGMRVELAAATAASIEHAIRRHYYGENRTPQKMARMALRKTMRAKPKPAPAPVPEEPPEAVIEEDVPEVEAAPVYDEQSLPSLEPEVLPEPGAGRAELEALAERVARLEAFVTQPQFAAVLARVERLEQIASQLAQAVRVIGGVIIDHELVSLEEYRRRTGQK